MLALAGWTGGGSVRAAQPSVELVLPSHAQAGDTVPITLRLRNQGDHGLDLQLPGRPVQFDIVIATPDGAEVWRRLRHGATGSALMVLHLAPGEFQDFTTTWLQVDNAGRRVAPGSYHVRGLLPLPQEGLSTAPRELVIER